MDRPRFRRFSCTNVRGGREFTAEPESIHKTPFDIRFMKIVVVRSSGIAGYGEPFHAFLRLLGAGEVQYDHVDIFVGVFPTQGFQNFLGRIVTYEKAGADDDAYAPSLLEVLFQPGEAFFERAEIRFGRANFLVEMIDKIIACSGVFVLDSVGMVLGKFIFAKLAEVLQADEFGKMIVQSASKGQKCLLLLDERPVEGQSKGPQAAITQIMSRRTIGP